MGILDNFKDKSNEMLFDKFQPFQRLQKQDFTFQPTRYEIWRGGEVVSKGKTNSIINARIVSVEKEEKIEVSFNDINLNFDLANKNIYDEFVTANDRLQLITIPNETNSENVGIEIFKITIGATRNVKNFNSDEPYCCNLFMKNGRIAKVTFSYSSPEKLIEFYSEPLEEENENLDLNDLEFVFHSSDHLRYEYGRQVSGPHGGAPRAIKVEPNVNSNKGYTVTMLNTDGGEAVVQMAPKQMKIIEHVNDKIVLRGYGYDDMGSSFDDYGLSILYKNNDIEKCILHMHDRNIDIEYLKSDAQEYRSEYSKEDGIEIIKEFLNTFISQPRHIKFNLADKTDKLNNIGNDYYESGDFNKAILYYNKALDIYPINDDALKNLIVCYKKTAEYDKIHEAQEKLDFLKKLGL